MFVYVHGNPHRHSHMRSIIMSMIRTYRDLVVWQRGKTLAKLIYQDSCAMPKSEMFGLTSQMRRAACSIPSNIAEGYARKTPLEYLRGLRIANGSLAELTTQWEIATELKLLPVNPVITDMLAEEDRMLSSLITKLEAK
jgi:four helix bundle protein